MAIEVRLDGHNKNGYVTLVDEQDIALVRSFRWYAHSRANGMVYAVARVKEQTVYLHRLLMGLGKGDRRIVDHVDRNGLNNTRGNLRVCTQTQNHANSRWTRPSTSEFRGVSWCRRSNKWSADIGFADKTKCLGKFEDEKEAARAYNRAAIERFGEFARLNEV